MKLKRNISRRGNELYGDTWAQDIGRSRCPVIALIEARPRLHEQLLRGTRYSLTAESFDFSPETGVAPDKAMVWQPPGVEKDRLPAGGSWKPISFPQIDQGALPHRVPSNEAVCNGMYKG